MNIAIDASSCAMPQSTGVGRYIRCLIRALAATDRENHYVICYRLSKLARRRHFLTLDGANFTTKLFQEPFTPFFWRGLDVFHGPDARLPGSNTVPMVATLLDVFA